jgi:hypothetical protein
MLANDGRIRPEIAGVKCGLCEPALFCPRFPFIDQEAFSEKPALASNWTGLDEVEAPAHENFLDHRRIADEKCAHARESQGADGAEFARCRGEKSQGIGCEVRKISGERATSRSRNLYGGSQISDAAPIVVAIEAPRSRAALIRGKAFPGSVVSQ